MPFAVPGKLVRSCTVSSKAPSSGAVLAALRMLKSSTDQRGSSFRVHMSGSCRRPEASAKYTDATKNGSWGGGCALDTVLDTVLDNALDTALDTALNTALCTALDIALDTAHGTAPDIAVGAVLDTVLN